MNQRYGQLPVVVVVNELGQEVKLKLETVYCFQLKATDNDIYVVLLHLL